jgi:hypothetical protein
MALFDARIYAHLKSLSNHKYAINYAISSSSGRAWFEGARQLAEIDKSALALSEQRRIRDRDYVKFVVRQIEVNRRNAPEHRA